MNYNPWGYKAPSLGGLLEGLRDEVVRALRAEGTDQRETTTRGHRASGADADLGSNLIKQRVARSGGGRSGGYRTLIAFHAPRRSVFLYGFAKKERENIDAKELADLKKLVTRFLSLTDDEVEKALVAHELKELSGNGREEDV